MTNREHGRRTSAQSWQWRRWRTSGASTTTLRHPASCHLDPTSAFSRQFLRTIHLPKHGCDVQIFHQEGIFPDWEDPRNAVGGRWMIGVDRWGIIQNTDNCLLVRQQRSETLDSHWLEILFFLIGEHADDHAHQVKVLFALCENTITFHAITWWSSILCPGEWSSGKRARQRWQAGCLGDWQR